MEAERGQRHQQRPGRLHSPHLHQYRAGQQHHQAHVHRINQPVNIGIPAAARKFHHQQQRNGYRPQVFQQPVEPWRPLGQLQKVP